MSEIDRYIAELISAAEKSGKPRTEIARESNLHANTLRLFGRPEWNPSLITLRRLEKTLRPPGATEKATSCA